MAQIIQPNLLVVGKVGWCLKYAREVFSIQAFYLTAAKAWAGAKYKHTGTPPKDASVFVHFDWVGNSDDHIAVWHKGKVYSSPLSGTGHIEADSIQDLINIFKNHTVNGKPSPITLIYLGWSEDVNNVRVWKEDTMQLLTNKNHLTILFKQFVNKTPTAAEYKDYLVTHNTLDYALNKLYPARIDLGKTIDERDTYKAKVNELTIKNQALTKQLEELGAQVDQDNIVITRSLWGKWYDKLKNLISKG